MRTYTACTCSWVPSSEKQKIPYAAHPWHNHIPSDPPPLCSLLPRSASSSSEPLEEHHVTQLLRVLSHDLTLPGGAPLALDRAMAQHLLQCPYHLRLLRNWLLSGQDLS